MKSWADHCSSDEESFNEDTPLEELEDTDDDLGPKAVGLPGHNEEHLKDLDDGDDDVDNNDPEEIAPPVKQQQQTRTYDYPSKPPYNIFVGNLAYSVKDSKKLTEVMTQLVQDRIEGNSIVIKDARVAFESRSAKNHRGFGYIEVESVDDMKLILELNAQDPPAMLAGRKVQFDTANQSSDNGNRRNNNNNRRAASSSEVDGRQFRGGRFNGNSQNNVDSSNRKGGRRESTGSSTAGQQRQSLKLQPRTKPVEGVAGSGNDKANSDNIFGGGRARDAANNNRSSNNRSNNNRGRNNGSTNNNTGRGGRGGGNNRPASDRRNRRSNNNNNNSSSNNNSSEEKKTPVVLPPKTTTQQEVKPVATKKKANSFAALLLDDSDSD